MRTCRCGRRVLINTQERKRIRKFKKRYPWVQQKHLAELFDVSPMRISEIIRKDKKRGGI
jgi:hypothetical protein